MSLKNTFFVGWQDDGHPRLPFDRLLKKYNIKPEIWPFIAFASFAYAFNVYKAIGLVLPDFHHESGAVMLRQLWEVSLNLHWIERDSNKRAQDFCNYTIMEFRKCVQKSGDSSPLQGFDDATNRFQAEFRFQNKRGKNQTHSNFAASTVQQRAEELGDPWQSDYALLYYLASMHAHGAPGAILHQHFVQQSKSPEAKEKDSTALIAYMSMKILIEDIRLLVRQGLARDSKAADDVFRDVLDIQNKEA